MRLIDWDNVLEWMHKQKETTEQWSMRIAIENYVDNMPTVEAIPIEWIEEWGWKNGMSESMSLRVMIDDWEKENGNQERPL